MGTLKLIHVVCAFLSISGFVGRGTLMIRGSSLFSTRMVKVLPHINDTVLLVTAIILASQWGWSALQMPWLLTKIIALLVYIALGMLALKPGRSQTVRISAWLSAIVIFVFIVSVAVTRNPLVIF